MNLEPEAISLEHMSVQEYLAGRQKITWKGHLRWSYRLLKYAIKTQINKLILRHEALFENPRGGAQEVERLRKTLIVDPLR
jgi:hypothetical protein